MNVVELVADPSECASDQRCRFGNRVDGHAVYCHNDRWTDSPRKCRRTWYTGGKTKDEDCPGFEKNLEFKGTLNPTPITAPLCTKCKGRRVIGTDRKQVETCPHCCGDGAEPSAIPLSQYEQDTLELGDLGGHGNCHFVRVATTNKERDSIAKLDELSLVQIRSVTFAPARASVFLLEPTGKGTAVMKANWKANKPKREKS